MSRSNERDEVRDQFVTYDEQLVMYVRGRSIDLM